MGRGQHRNTGIELSANFPPQNQRWFRLQQISTFRKWLCPSPSYISRSPMLRVEIEKSMLSAFAAWLVLVAARAFSSCVLFSILVVPAEWGAHCPSGIAATRTSCAHCHTQSASNAHLRGTGTPNRDTSPPTAARQVPQSQRQEHITARCWLRGHVVLLSDALTHVNKCMYRIYVYIFSRLLVRRSESNSDCEVWRCQSITGISDPSF